MRSSYNDKSASERLVIYDVDKDMYPDFTVENNSWFEAAPIVNNCVGCFGCWIKTPGACVIKDRCSVIPGMMSQSSEVVIISPVCYGSYSANIKAVLDRSIAYILPYFRIVRNEMHHKMRYENPFKLNVCFYGACDEEEKQIAECLVKANALNLGAGSSQVTFYSSIYEVREALG